ncbi:MAG TPA: ATP-binding protein [Chloroflexota bacterium]
MCTWEYDVVRDRLAHSALPTDSVARSLRLFGFSGAEILARFHADDRARVQRLVAAALERGQGLRFECRTLPGPTGSRWLTVSGAVERDAGGHALRIVGVARDVTDLKEAEAARHAQAQGERLRALGEMASGIAHDLNQSLALITGYSDMVRQELSLEAPDVRRAREMVEITSEAAIAGGLALRGLLAFVRNQELMVGAERLDVAELLRDVARLTAPRWRDAPQAEGRPIDLSVEAEPNCAIDGSVAALHEAITNLIFNAVDALPGGGRIRLSAHSQGDRVILDVSDTGTGIPREVQSRIFDPFFTTKGERGTGLGLSQVLAVVERHAATIDVDSDPGTGTRFRLDFPASTEVPLRSDTPAADRRSVPPVRSLRILVVEDEQQLARMASLVLSQRGHHTTVASSGDEALGLLEDQRFDLVISDLGLGPGRNGWDLADSVRTRWPGTRFVLVTGWGAAIDPSEALARGVACVIAKPYRIAELRQVADDVAAAFDNE